jgi:hypothetical protein
MQGTEQLGLEAVESWWRHLEELEARGCFFAGVSGFIVTGCTG